MAMVCRTGAKECCGCTSCQEQIAVYTCAGCGEDICEGEDYYKIIEDAYCESCVSRETAEREE